MCVLLLLTALGSTGGNVLLLYVFGCYIVLAVCVALCANALKVVVTCIVRHCIITQFVYDLLWSCELSSLGCEPDWFIFSHINLCSLYKLRRHSGRLDFVVGRIFH